ncbi:MAG: hypothetical protein ACE5H9_06870, partial [Anaerolineae bacterium]
MSAPKEDVNRPSLGRTHSNRREKWLTDFHGYTRIKNNESSGFSVALDQIRGVTSGIPKEPKQFQKSVFFCKAARLKQVEAGLKPAQWLAFQPALAGFYLPEPGVLTLGGPAR